MANKKGWLDNELLKGYDGDRLDEQKTFSPDDAPIKTKEQDPKWMLKNLQAMFYLYVRNQTGVAYTGVLDMINRRAYAAGRQSIQKYRTQLLDDADAGQNSGWNEGNKADRKGWLNINWEVISEIPKLKNIVVSMAEMTKYDVKVNAIDKNAGLEKERLKFSAILNTMMQNIFAAAQAQEEMGTPNEIVSKQKIEEIELAYTTGNLKTEIEISLQKFLKASFEESSWDDQIIDQVVGDLFENNIAAVRDVIDPYSGRVKQEYVDPTKLIIQYSETHQFEQSMFGAHITKYTIRDIRARTGLAEEELLKFAKVYNGICGNLSFNDDTYGLYNFWDATKESYIYDDFNIYVLEGEILSNDTIKFTKKTDRSGTERFFRETNTAEGNVVTKAPRLYKGSWIIGTDYVFDYGAANYIVRENQRPRLSYHVFRVPGPSLVDRLIPLADMYCLNWYKLQNALAMAPPQGLAVEWKALQNVMLGGKKLSPADILRLRTQTGYMPYASTNIFGKVNSSQQFPFQEMRGGIGSMFSEFVGLFDLFEKISQRLTGFNDIAAAVQPKAESGLGVQQMSYQSSSNALSHIFKGAQYLKKSVAKNCVKRIQLIARYGDKGYEGYVDTIGGVAMQSLKITSDKEMYEMGIRVSTMPTREMVQEVKGAALEAMRAGKNGQPGIDMPDYLMIVRELDNNNLEYAQALLTYKVNKLNERQERMQQENMMLNGQNAVQLEETKQKGKMKELKTKMDLEMRNKLVEKMAEQHAELSNTESMYFDNLLNGLIQEMEAEKQQRAQAEEAAMNEIMGQMQKNQTENAPM